LAGETIPAIVLETENQATALAQLKILKFVALTLCSPISKGWGILKIVNLT
jgi:hypothetical protein